jgi:type IV secretory pathway VirB3-like protein
MLLACPAEGVMVNVVSAVLVGAWVGVISGRPLLEFAYWLVITPAVHLVMRAGAARDYNWFRTKKLGIETKGYGTVTWGGSTVTPLPHGLPTSVKELSFAL